MSTTSRTRAAAIAAAVVILAIIVGCMSFSIGGGETTVREEVSTSDIVPVGYAPGETIFEQHDRVVIAPNCEADVFYPMPYYSRPNLSIYEGDGHVKIVAQYRDHFRIKNDGLFERNVRWLAKGVKLVVVPAVHVTPAIPPPEPLPQLPVEPVPIKPQP